MRAVVRSKHSLFTTFEHFITPKGIKYENLALKLSEGECEFRGPTLEKYKTSCRDRSKVVCGFTFSARKLGSGTQTV